MLSAARNRGDFPAQLFAGHGVSPSLKHTAESCSNLIATILEVLHDRQIQQAEREIERYRHWARSN